MFPAIFGADVPVQPALPPAFDVHLYVVPYGLVYKVSES